MCFMKPNKFYYLISFNFSKICLKLEGTNNLSGSSLRNQNNNKVPRKNFQNKTEQKFLGSQKWKRKEPEKTVSE